LPRVSLPIAGEYREIPLNTGDDDMLAGTLADGSGPDGVYQVAFTLVSRLKEMLDFTELFLTDEPSPRPAEAAGEQAQSTPDATSPADRTGQPIRTALVRADPFQIGACSGPNGRRGPGG
jgi:hypothetical protein